MLDNNNDDTTTPSDITNLPPYYPYMMSPSLSERTDITPQYNDTTTIDAYTLRNNDHSCTNPRAYPGWCIKPLRNADGINDYSFFTLEYTGLNDDRPNVSQLIADNRLAIPHAIRDAQMGIFLPHWQIVGYETKNDIITVMHLRPPPHEPPTTITILTPALHAPLPDTSSSTLQHQTVASTNQRPPIPPPRRRRFAYMSTN